jgi:putative restriction endonuclease
LQQIRKRFPTWKLWRNLRGVRVIKVPEHHRRALAALVVHGNPSARTFLSPWLPNGTRVKTAIPESTVRDIGTVRRRLRDSTFGRRVRKASGGECAACLPRTNYDALGVLEAAHVRRVQNDGPDTLANALALCPNHHALFDQGFWTVDGKRIVLRPGLPREIRRTFAPRLRCKWTLDPREVQWHRHHVFNEHAG